MKLCNIIAGALVLVSSATMANTENNKGWYAGFGLGSSTYSTDTVADDSEVSITAFGGYKFNNYFALQVNAIKLGEYAGDGVVLNSTDIGGVSMTAVGILPLGEQGFELFARLGLGFLSYNQNYDLWDTEYSNSSIGETLVASVGLNYTPVNFQQMTFHLAYENYYFETEYEYNSATESNSIGVIMLGARYNF